MTGYKGEIFEKGQKMRSEIMKRTIKDSVFTNLFQDRKYLIQLYQALHPEDRETTVDELKDITIRNVLTDNIYNDLGFMVGSRLMILVEAQSTWTVNIIIRAFLYLAQTYHEYLMRTKQNLYKGRKVQMPVPEIYVIYTGDRKERPDEISLSQEFFSGQECSIEVKVKMIYDGKEGDIINQYVLFTKVCGEQIARHGRSRKAVLNAIRICKDRNVLREYLESREKEVMDIMMLLDDEEEITRMYIESEIEEGIQKGIEREMQKSIEQGMQKGIEQGMQKGIEQGMQKGIQQGMQKGIQETQIETARRMLEDGGLSLEKIARFSNLSIEIVKQLAENQI